MRTVGRYEILWELGRGGVAIAHVARHLPSGRTVVLKEPLSDDPAVRKRFVKAAKVGHGMRHPNVVRVRHAFAYEGTPFMGMQYLERGSLRPLLQELSTVQLVAALEGALAGLAYIAERGVVHGNLKPENLLVSGGGRVAVTDFALAKRVDSTFTPDDLRLGTPEYTAPEQEAGAPVDARSDLYALGRIAAEAARSELSDWVARLVAREPAERPASAAAAWRELEAIVVQLAGPDWREAAALPSGLERCSECGAGNPPEADFCRSCGVYLRWDPPAGMVAAEEDEFDDLDEFDEIPLPAREGPPPPPMQERPRRPERLSVRPRPRPARPSGKAMLRRELRPALSPREVRRTPHMDLSLEPPLVPASVFEVSVYTDETDAREGEDVEEIVVKVPRDRTAIELDVWLVATHHFVITDQPIRRITVRVDSSHSTTATFRVAVVAVPEHGEEPLITASFSCDGRPTGRVTRVVPIGAAAGPVPVAASAPAVEVNLATEAPDLTIEIAAPENDGRRFEVRVHTPLLKLEHRTEPWFLPEDAATMVSGAMERFFDRDASPRARMSSLLGAGLEFFDAAPQLFKDVYWRLLDEGRPPRSLFVVSDERTIPWELMVPSRGGEQLDPLGVQMAVGRWHRQSGVSPRQRMRLTSSVVVAPQSSRLEHAAAEAEFVCRHFAGSRVEPASFDNLDIALERAGADLLHFVCHGEADEREQVLLLQDPDKLYSQQLRAMPGLAKACREHRPFVFLNACELGRHGPGLSAASGFAKSFIDVDATCVVGTLWSVDDRIAHAVAIEFYESLLEQPGTPFAEILRRIRRRGYEAPDEDSWAAYCFYGDPAARIG